ncbi:hypothetical protein LCGC14_2643190 [marine sediment metagenome]|uniref:Uncharacterized protein n=1 Tax=marine sediment metagenome TaxID=412755 RepID=A0A0F8ZX56_9ZZZZ
MIQRYSEDDGLDTMGLDEEGDWVPYSDYAKIERLYIELVDGINALGFPVHERLAPKEKA